MLAALAQGAGAQQQLSLFQIGVVAEEDPARAIAAIDALIATGEIIDQRSALDVLLLKAELLEETGQGAEAAALYMELAQAARRDRERAQLDPADLLERAVALYMGLGETRRAERALRAVLEDQRDGGAAAEVLAGTLRRLADLTKGAASTRYAEAAAAALDAATPTRGSDAPGGYRAVDVFYATDRARTGNARPTRFYGGARGALELGVATVTIPETHRTGDLEEPSIWKLEFGPNPAKHVVLQDVTPVPAEQFWSQMNSTLTELQSSDAFVFVHGYNVRFDAAARRAAQLAYDMNFPGVPILYSWPSRGKTVGYIADTAVVRLSGRRLSRFLDDIVEKSGARTIHIVGHSMGNRALTDALELLALRRGVKPGDPPIFDQILFAAPDVDADLFAEMMPVIRPTARRLTLYASEQDWALETSKQLHGNAPRAGQGGAGMLSRKEFDSIDMSALGEDMLAHSYFADDSSALADIVALFWRNVPPSQRCGLRPQQAANSIPVWQYVVGTCGDRRLVDVMVHLRKKGVTDAKTAKEVLAATDLDPDLAQALAPIMSNLLSE